MLRKLLSHSTITILQRGFLFFALFFFVSFCNEVEIHKTVAKSGILDLRNIDLEMTSVELNGEWEFYKEELLTPLDPKKATTFISVPGVWNESMQGKYGYASYRLHLVFPEDKKILLSIKLPEFGTAYRLFLNGKILAGVGEVGKDVSESKPKFRPLITSEFLGEGEMELLFHISNYHYREGGFWYTALLGTKENLKSLRENNLLLDMFLLGSILIMGIYHLGLFFIRRQDKSPLFFSLFCFVILFRLLSQNERYLLNLFPGISFITLNRIEYLGYYMALPCFAGFLRSLFKEEFSEKVFHGMLVLASLFSAIVLFTDSIVYTETANYFHVFTLFTFLYFFYSVTRALVKRREGVWLILVGTLFIIAGTTNDILHSQELIHTTFLFPYALLAFIFIQSVVLSIRFSRAFQENEILMQELLTLNSVNKKFVPFEFLENLGKKNLFELNLGDQIQKEMTILFSDIRDFTTISEKMSPEENFQFINEYLSKMGPLVRKHKGFIDKFIGDAIMALYTNPEEAIHSAIEMQEEIRKFNSSQMQKGKPGLEVGIGIHTGKLMMGIIGEEERYDGTVISDAVNMASRIEGLTKHYKAKILVSEDVLLQLDDFAQFSYMKLDIVRVKGKQDTFAIYEILEGLPEEKLNGMLSTKFAFETGVECFLNKDFEEAALLFEKVLKEHPDHSSARLYLQKCNQAMETGINENWNPSTTHIEK